MTIKWWAKECYQEVVDRLKGRIIFVQVGAKDHHHPRIDGTVDIRGKTSLRDLIHLVYHAQGILCPVTLAMHLAAAVPLKDQRTGGRPCVVIAGGREPPHWEAYPHHQFIHTVGSLWCCSKGGCWKTRVRPMGDGHENDVSRSFCVDIVGELPRCMDMITPSMVIDRIELYYRGGILMLASFCPLMRFKMTKNISCKDYTTIFKSGVCSNVVDEGCRLGHPVGDKLNNNPQNKINRFRIFPK